LSEHKLPVPVILTAAQIAAKQATGHSVFSPSAAEMTMTCEDSLVVNTLAEDDQTYDAALGTVAHGVAEEWVRTDVYPGKWIGYVEDVRGFEIEIDEEMLGFVEEYYDLCSQAKEEYEQWFVEQSLDTSHLTPIPNQGGTGDFMAMRWQRGILIDYKHGKDPVFAYYRDTETINKQLGVYASAMFREWDWLYNFQEIEIVICQPRIPNGITRYVISRSELLEFERFAKKRWAASWKPNRTRTPSTKGCRWCKVRATCPALYLFLQEDVDDVFDDHEQLEERTYEQSELAGANDVILDDMAISPFPRLPKPPQLSTAALAKLLRYRKLMESFFNAIEAELLSRAISYEEEIPWWKIVESRTQRRYVDDEEFVIETLTDLGLKESDLYEKKMLTMGKLERLIHTKLKMKLADAKRWLNESGLTVKPQGRKTLAATNDSRLELPKDGDVFDSWEEDDI
jgi:hypothetical protein